jgi:hypothetical protein
MTSPLSTDNPTPGGLISNRLASSLNDIRLPKSKRDSFSTEPSLFVAAYPYEYLSTLYPLTRTSRNQTGLKKLDVI